MKVVILAGGRGTRLAEETSIKPKPMVEIGQRPMLWHIMKIYEAFNYKEFVVALGYLGEVIKQYFLGFASAQSDLTISLASGDVAVGDSRAPDWTVHLVDSGLETMTGGRLKRLSPWLAGRRFMMTYGDGVADINIERLVEFHESHHKLATVTIVRPPARFGGVVLEGSQVVQFTEKPQAERGWINGGFFVLEPEVLHYIEDDATIFERSPLERLAMDGQLMAYSHTGFWQPMDTLRDRNLLDELWRSGQAPWRVWN